MRHEAGAAPRFVHAGAPDRDAFFGFKSALRVVRGLATLQADGVSLRDVFRDGEQLRHRLPGFSGVVLIEVRDDHAHTTLG